MVDVSEFDSKTCRCKECQNNADLLKYKKYNYKRRKIEVMRRYELLKNIEKGEIK